MRIALRTANPQVAEHHDPEFAVPGQWPPFIALNGVSGTIFSPLTLSLTLNNSP